MSSSNHTLLKRLQTSREKLDLRKDDIAVGDAALADESRELEGKQQQLAMVQVEIANAVREMDQLGVKGRAEKAKQEEFLHEEEALRHTFTTILDHGIKELREERRRAMIEAEKAGAVETELREVSVLFGDEEAVFRVSDDSYTFDELTTDACRFFELHPLDVLMVDDQDERWAGDASVRQKMAAYDNAYGRVFLKMREEEGDEEELEDPDNILQLLLNEEEEAEEEEDEEEEPPEMQAVQVVLRGANQDKGKKKKKKLNRGQLYRELPIFILFTLLFIVSLTFRRQTVAGYYQVNAIRTILVEEAFGDFNEKTYADIANFEEIWDWIEGVLVEGLYPEGKYNDEEFNKREVGTVMTYNRIVGAIRLRTVRSVPNVECPGVTASLNKRLVQNSSGDIYDQLFVDECHGAASPGNEQKYPYGPGIDLMAEYPNCEAIPAPPPPPSVFLDVYGVPPTEEQLQAMAIRKLCRAFTWSPATQDDEFPDRFYTGEAGTTGKLGFYPGGGYVRDTDNPIDCRQRPETDPFPNPEGVCERGEAARADLLLAIDQLKSNRWLDEATRAMFIKVTFYNGNLGFFMVITFVLEFSQGGVVWPKTEMSVVNQEMYKTDTQFGAPTAAPLSVAPPAAAFLPVSRALGGLVGERASRLSLRPHHHDHRVRHLRLHHLLHLRAAQQRLPVDPQDGLARGLPLRRLQHPRVHRARRLLHVELPALLAALLAQARHGHLRGLLHRLWQHRQAVPRDVQLRLALCDCALLQDAQVRAAQRGHEYALVGAAALGQGHRLLHDHARHPPHCLLDDVRAVLRPVDRGLLRLLSVGHLAAPRAAGPVRRAGHAPGLAYVRRALLLPLHHCHVPDHDEHLPCHPRRGVHGRTLRE